MKSDRVARRAEGRISNRGSAGSWWIATSAVVAGCVLVASCSNAVPAVEPSIQADGAHGEEPSSPERRILLAGELPVGFELSRLNEFRSQGEAPIRFYSSTLKTGAEPGLPLARALRIGVSRPGRSALFEAVLGSDPIGCCEPRSVGGRQVWSDPMYATYNIWQEAWLESRDAWVGLMAFGLTAEEHDRVVENFYLDTNGEPEFEPSALPTDLKEVHRIYGSDQEHWVAIAAYRRQDQDGIADEIEIRTEYGGIVDLDRVALLYPDGDRSEIRGREAAVHESERLFSATWIEDDATIHLTLKGLGVEERDALLAGLKLAPFGSGSVGLSMNEEYTGGFTLDIPAHPDDTPESWLVRAHAVTIHACVSSRRPSSVTATLHKQQEPMFPLLSAIAPGEREFDCRTLQRSEQP